MKVDDFDFDLPPELIAQAPAEPRDSARLLEVGTHGCTDRIIRDLPQLLGPGDVLVVNNTRVLPTRLVAKRNQATIDVTLVEKTGNASWKAFCRPAKKLTPGDELIIADDLTARVDSKDGGEVALTFSVADPELTAALWQHGAMPLPPYIKRERGGRDEDNDSYQTLFAAKDGAVAAPTAGLHFTPALREAIEAMGARFAEVTLHVGAGTFLPVKTDDVHDHKMHSEWYELDEKNAALIRQADRVIAVGTTSLRTLESIAARHGELRADSGDTDIFITPGYRFGVVDALLTNFHLPRSTLFMLVSALCGRDRMQAAYAHAIAAQYRFFSYGDACFLPRLNDIPDADL